MRLLQRDKSLFFALTSSIVLCSMGSSCQGVAIEEQPLVSEKGVLIPAGQALAHPLKLEPGVILTQGAWVHDGSDAHEPDNYVYQEPATLTEALELPAGSIFVGDVIIPPEVSLEPGSILPGGRVLDSSGADTTLLDPAVLVPPNAALSAEVNAIPPAALLTGALPVLETDLPVPAGTIFPNGTRTPDGEVIANALPDAFGNVVAAEATTLPAGTLMLGGMQLPDGEGIWIDAESNGFVGSYRLPADATVPSPGIGLPAGTRLDAAVLIPRGAAFLIDSTLPAQTQVGLGYLEPPMASPPEINKVDGSTLGADTLVPRGTALLGDALIPENVGVLAAPLFLPGGSVIGRGLVLPDQELLGMIVPPTGTFATSSFNPANIPADTLLLGYADPTKQDLPVPPGAEFLSGYQLPDGTFVQPEVSTDATTLPAGSVLLGGIILPTDNSGAYLTFNADLMLAGGVMIPAGKVQQPNGLTIPVNSLSVSGTTGGLPADADFGEILAAPLDMPPTAIYCKAAAINDATGFAKITTAKIEYRIDGQAQTLVEIATDYAFTNIIQTFSPDTVTGLVEIDVMGLDPETTYYFRVSLQGCGGGTSVIQGFRTTHDPCGGEFELVSPGDVYDGWDGRFGTAVQSALHISQMKINPADDRLYIAASKQLDGTAILYRSTADFLGITEAGLTVGNQAVRNSTAIGFQNFGDDDVYMSFKDNANRGFSLYRWVLGDFSNAVSVASAEGTLGGIGAADREGFGDAANVWITDMLGGELGNTNVMYASVRTTGALYMADGSGSGTPGDARDFTDCASCGLNSGAGAIWNSGTNNIGALAYVDAGATSGMFLGIGQEGGAGAQLAFMSSADVGSTTPTITPLAIANFAGEVIVDIAVLNEDLVMSLQTGSGGQAWICAGYASNDCGAGGSWAKLVDFGDGTGLSGADGTNVSVRWVRQMPTSGHVYIGTENNGGAQIWSAPDFTTDLQQEPGSACGGLGDGSLTASPAAASGHNVERNVDILYFALHQYALYEQADAAPNNVYVYRRLEEL
jgi:hypothetical protein